MTTDSDSLEIKAARADALISLCGSMSMRALDEVFRSHEDQRSALLHILTGYASVRATLHAVAPDFGLTPELVDLVERTGAILPAKASAKEDVPQMMAEMNAVTSRFVAAVTAPGCGCVPCTCRRVLGEPPADHGPSPLVDAPPPRSATPN